MPFPAALDALPGVPGRFALRVEPEHPAFEGHFPDDPLLSGLIQVDWALRLGCESFAITGVFRRLDHLKFQAPIRPDEPVELSLSWEAAAGELAFRYAGDHGPKSQGIAVFSPAP